jgi:hypothetical protein
MIYIEQTYKHILGEARTEPRHCPGLPWRSSLTGRMGKERAPSSSSIVLSQPCGSRHYFQLVADDSPRWLRSPSPPPGWLVPPRRHAAPFLGHAHNEVQQARRCAAHCATDARAHRRASRRRHGSWARLTEK